MNAVKQGQTIEALIKSSVLNDLDVACIRENNHRSNAPTGTDEYRLMVRVHNALSDVDSGLQIAYLDTARVDSPKPDYHQIPFPEFDKIKDIAYTAYNEAIEKQLGKKSLGLSNAWENLSSLIPLSPSQVSFASSGYSFLSNTNDDQSVAHGESNSLEVTAANQRK